MQTCGRTQNGISCRVVHDESLECRVLQRGSRISRVRDGSARLIVGFLGLVSQETNDFETSYQAKLMQASSIMRV